MNTFSKLGRAVSVAVVALALSLGIQYVMAAGSWTAPTQAPPNGNADAPINAGIDNQSKLGALRLNTTLSSPATYGLDVFGISRFFGNVEIGTSTAPATIRLIDGNQANGRVLTSNASGVGTWQDATGGGGGNNIVITEYGPYSYLVETSIGVHDYCALSNLQTGLENHGARVWKESGVWKVRSSLQTDDSAQTFRVMCFSGNISGGSGQTIEHGLASLACNASASGGNQSVAVDLTSVGFSSVPHVTITPNWTNYNGDEGSSWWISSLTSSGFTINVHHPNDGTCYGASGVHWVAMTD